MSHLTKIAALALVAALTAVSVAEAETALQNAIRTGSIVTPHGVWDGK